MRVATMNTSAALVFNLGKTVYQNSAAKCAGLLPFLRIFSTTHPCVISIQTQILRLPVIQRLPWPSGIRRERGFYVNCHSWTTAHRGSAIWPPGLTLFYCWSRARLWKHSPTGLACSSSLVETCEGLSLRNYPTV